MASDPGTAEIGSSAGDPGEEDIRQALERATGKPPLSRSKRLSRFLRYVVDETLAGRAETISGYAIAVDVFRKPESFDPAIDSIVRVEAGRLRQRLAEYYREAGAEDPVEISLPKGNYIPAFSHRASEPKAETRRAAPPSHGPSLVVLPFENYGGNPEDQFFADGLTEEIIANLARFKDLFVFSRSTSTKLARDGADIGQLHDKLGVDFVIEGSIRKSSQVVRVTVQLIDAVTEGHIFAEQFETPCTPEAVFEIQDQVARLVAGRVANRYGPIGRHVARAARSGRPQRWETYIWIARFYEYYACHDPALHGEVRDGLESALEQDSESSDALAALAAVYLDEHRLHLNEQDNPPALDRALETALRAVACDPENAMAYQFLACTYYHRSELTDFEVAAQRAVELNPGHADVLADVGFCYACGGQWDRGLALIDRAMEINPVHPGWYHTPRALRLALDGDPEAAVLEMKQGPMPGVFMHHALLCCFLHWAGRDGEAKQEAETLVAINDDFASSAERECKIWLQDEEAIGALLKGWKEAGLTAA